MAAALRYSGVRPVVTALVLAVLYFVVLPASWPEPKVRAHVPSTAVLGEDLPVEVTVLTRFPEKDGQMPRWMTGED